MTTPQILHFLRSHKSEFNQKFGVTKLGLFGSYARGEATEKSDIDIIVDMPSDFNLYYDFKEFLEDSFNLNIDLGLIKTIRKQLNINIQKDVIYV